MKIVMNEIVQKEEIKVENMIYEIRGKQVMLDRDLAKLYECANGTKTINLAVKRHIKRFPGRFMFQLTKEEAEEIYSRFQVETLNDLRGSNIKYLSYVFTEQGVAMLATILRTKVAEEVSIRIMDAFVEMRKYINNNFIEQTYINKLVIKDHERINLLEETFNKLEEKTKINSLFFEGQIYDAYSLLMDILNKSNKKIIIIDNYAGKELLDILKDIDREITIISSNISKELEKKYLSQYNNIRFICKESFHDRFIIIDEQILYHCGSSFKDLGKKCFAINRIDDKNILDSLMKEIILI